MGVSRWSDAGAVPEVAVQVALIGEVGRAAASAALSARSQAWSRSLRRWASAMNPSMDVECWQVISPMVSAG
jgi:hypothetical protein